MEWIVILAALLCVAFLQILIYRSLKNQDSGKDNRQDMLLLYEKLRQDLDRLKQDMGAETKNSRQELSSFVQGSFNNLGEILSSSQRNTSQVQDRRLAELNEQLTHRSETLQHTVNVMLAQMDERMSVNAIQNEQKLENIRKTMESRISALQEENSKKLDEMRATVDEKLQKTLEERISKSFSLVSERLEQVYKGLGEMQNLASGVGDLKKVLSNVKTRGVLGEIQLGAILEQIMSREQYEENVAVKKGSERVEFAIKFPGDEEDAVYLPIDAKFPADVYQNLLNAYDNGTKEEIEAAKAMLKRAIKSCAKMIHDKYIEPPHTTDFAVMFLPFEGLYAEVVREGMVETLQREYKVNIAGPTTMAALLNSLQMGFRTLAIQKHSGEVWKVLGAVKSEFDKFGDVLTATQKRLNQANEELDRLVGTRTRMIQRKLKNVELLSQKDGREALELNAGLVESEALTGYEILEEE